MSEKMDEPELTGLVICPCEWCEAIRARVVDQVNAAMAEGAKPIESADGVPTTLQRMDMEEAFVRLVTAMVISQMRGQIVRQASQDAEHARMMLLKAMKMAAEVCVIAQVSLRVETGKTAPGSHAVN